MWESNTAEIRGWFLEGPDYGTLAACEDNCVQGNATEKVVNSDPCSLIQQAEVNCCLKIKIGVCLPSLKALCSSPPYFSIAS